MLEKKKEFMSCLEISGAILADFPFVGTFSDEFPSFAPVVLNFLKLPFSNPRAQRAGDRSVLLSPCFISIALLPKLAELSLWDSLFQLYLGLVEDSLIGRGLE